jgi:hypothetical protein
MDGIVFDSKVEMTRWASLMQLYKAGQITDLKRQPSFSVEINNQHFCTYTADFIYKLASTDEEIIEDVKTTGTEKDAAYRLRKKAAELYHGVQIYAVDKNGTLLKKPRNRLTKPKKSVK